MVQRRVWFAAVVIACGAFGVPAAVANPHCGPTFAYGNAGYGAGYSISGVRGLHCGSGFWSGGGACGPWWRGGYRVGGWPDCGGGWWFGRPGFGFGGWPMNWYPGCAVGAWGWYPYAVPAPVGVGPQFGPAGILPFLGANASAGTGTARVAAAARGAAAPRLVNAAARRRAERLVAVGDRHLREARAGAPARARAAVDAYRRAATAAPDDPDIRLREALALVALGDANAADAAIVRATAIDGRLAAAPPRRADLPPDPVFGDRGPGEPGPLAARGQALLREIAGADGDAVAWLAGLWSDRWAGNAAAVVSR